ncbi:MAG: hypothetical protein E7514_07615 [Ruminococcaceae bacterium]|nr:hypothetical protein [Oscillospiraceae bacterium]
MKGFLVLIIQCVRGMNKISRYYIRFGGMVVWLSLVAALFCHFSLGRLGNFDTMLYYRREFFILFRDMAGAVYVPGLLVEIARLLNLRN